MNEMVKIISAVPIRVLEPAQEEIVALDWSMYTKMDKTRRRGVFRTSTAIMLRVLPSESNIRPCIDTELRRCLSATDRLVEWIFETVNGVSLGKVMIVNLEPHGVVGDHVDEGLYFERHARFHVPLKTTLSFTFKGEHMPTGYLCCLNNRAMHGGINNSESERIHLIVDVEPMDSDRKKYFR